MEQFIGMTALGLAAGVIGTLIGAGGGFIVIPVLLLLAHLQPSRFSADPGAITTISLTVVFFNALSGSIAYARMRRIDFRAGALFAAATVPGAILGAYTTYAISTGVFNGILGVVMIAVSLFLVFRKPPSPDAQHRPRWRIDTTHTIVERDGKTHTFSFSRRLGVSISVGVGYLASLLGIGGGVIHVPAMATLLNFPIHVATATSHFTLAVMSFAGLMVHVAEGSFQQQFDKIIPLVVGVIAGAQVGAWLSNKIHGRWILRLLALALTAVGIRLVIGAFL